MSTDPRTSSAVNCDDCGLVARDSTDPLKVLSRLPRSLFNMRRPTETQTPGAIFDDVFADITYLDADPMTVTEATPQWDLARIIAEEKDLWVQAFRQSQVNQLGLGNVGVVDGRSAGEGLRARGADLDRVGEQFGIGRPRGFTDCCYWRLITLLIWKPGPTKWLLTELAALYTGVRPKATDGVNILTLEWPEHVASGSFGASYLDHNAYLDHSAYLATDPDPGGESTALDAYLSAETSASLGSTYLTEAPVAPPGLTLADAIKLAKPAGIFIETVREPLPGLAGCYGATLRAAATLRGRLA